MRLMIKRGVMPSLRVLLCVGLMGFALSGTTGCLAHRRGATSLVRGVLQQENTPPFPNLTSLKPNQVGLVLGDPVTDSKTQSDFAAGCGRWLLFAMGGQPEFGATPSWRAQDRGRHRLGKQNLQLSAAEAAQMSAWIGGTHFGVGTLTGETTLTLTYRLYQASDSKPIGEPVTLTGTQAEITKGLPELARKLSVQLGLATPHIPDQTGVTAQELAKIGELAWITVLYYSSAHTQPVREIAERSPLAGIILLSNYAYRSGEATYLLAKTLAKQAPDHPFVFIELRENASDLFFEAKDRIRELHSRYPNNYCYTHAQTWILRHQGDYKAAKQMAESAVQCAPTNPDTWLLLGAAVSETANAVRQSRFIGEMSKEELATIEKIYPEWEGAIKRATEIDPGYGKAWQRLATAAAFNGNGELADTAFWKALPSEREQSNYYWWGLQMYQPKWYPDPAKLKKIAEIAASTAYSNANNAIFVVYTLREHGYEELAKQLCRKTLPRLEQAIREHPEDGYSHYDYARVIGLLEHKERMMQEYREAIRLLPNTPFIQDELAVVHLNLREYEQALVLVKDLLRRYPDTPLYLYRLGYTLFRLNRMKEAEPPTREVVRLVPKNFANHSLLAEILTSQGKYEEALAEFKTALELKEDWQVRLSLGRLYVASKQPDKAIELLEKLAPFHSNDVWLNIYLSDAYLLKKDLKLSEKYMREVVRIMPKDGEAHFKLGNRLIELGQRAAAREEWQTTLKLDREGLGDEALKMLKKYP